MSEQKDTPNAPETEGQTAGAGGSARSAVSGRAEFAPQLESFQGPLDLLLYLLKEEEVDIHEIPIARILEQYVRHLDAAENWDLHMAGEFLVMAATLMEIKSRELLPAPEPLEGEEIIEDPRSELVRQLLRYRRLKDLARDLEARREAWARRRPRGAYDSLPEVPTAAAPEPLPFPDIDLYELLTLFERLRQAVLADVPKDVAYEGETLEEKITRLEGVLKKRPFARFAELLGGATSRPEIALTFIALLELVRRRLIQLLQDGAYGALSAKVQTAEEAEAVARREAADADNVVDIALKEKAEREAQLAAEAAALGVAAEQLPWKRRRTLLARPKFRGLVRPEDVEEIDAAEAEISRRIDAILAAADAVSQRFEESRLAQGTEGAQAEGVGPAGQGAAEAPLTESDLRPTPEQPPEAG